jgi:hypothetical protein
MEANRKKKKTSQQLKQARHFIKGKVFTKSTGPLTGSRAKYE